MTVSNLISIYQEIISWIVQSQTNDRKQYAPKQTSGRLTQVDINWYSKKLFGFIPSSNNSVSKMVSIEIFLCKNNNGPAQPAWIKIDCVVQLVSGRGLDKASTWRRMTMAKSGRSTWSFSTARLPDKRQREDKHYCMIVATHSALLFHVFSIYQLIYAVKCSYYRLSPVFSHHFLLSLTLIASCAPRQFNEYGLNLEYLHLTC